MAQDKPMPSYIKFIFGGSAGMAGTLVVQPLDLLKNRMQLSGVGKATREYKNSFHALQSIVKNEGVLALYTGLSAGLLRQATYTTGRMGVYGVLFDYWSNPDGSPPGFFYKALCGMVAGAVGAFVGTPSEVALIRMTADGRLPVADRRNYKHVGNALTRIVQEEGVLMLFRGAIPTMGRAMIVNMAQLSTYSQIKQVLLEKKYLNDNIALHFVASMFSGFVTTCVSMPVDIAKTRIQNMKTINGKPEYSGVLDVFGRIIKNEGIFALWKGFTPYYARLGPHTVLVFVFLEQFNSLYKKYA